VDKKKRRLYVEPTVEYDDTSLKFANFKNGRNVPRISTAKFCPYLFDLMKWDPNAKYRILTIYREFGDKKVMIFNLGLEVFSETQVLEYALGIAIPRVDTNPIAHRLVSTFGGLAGVIDAHPDKIQEVAGIGETASIFLNFLKQFITYYQNNAKGKRTKIRTPADAICYLREVMKTYSTEQFVLLCLDKSGAIILEQTTTSGDLDKVDINLRQIVDIALRVKTTSVIIAHNHLGENANPSDADIMLTRWLVNILTPLGVKVIDHIIFARAGAIYSFHEHKLLEIFKREHKSFSLSRDFEEYWVDTPLDN
jgi:DNA repair protein RadC